MGLNDWKSWGFSVIGPSHQKRGVPNQDAWISRHYSWGDIIVVSDGVGSKKRSDIGSAAACRAVVKAAAISKGFPRKGIEYFLRLVHSIWLLLILPYRPDECSATCLFAIRKGTACLIAQLGDGMIAAIGGQGEPILFSDDKQDSFSNITYCLRDNFQAEQWQISVIDLCDYDALILCSDGISDDIVPENRLAFASGLYLSYRECSVRERRKDVNSWLKNWPVPHHSDDKTIACLYRGN